MPPPKGLLWLFRESRTQPLCLPHPPGLPGLAGTLQRCHVKAPDAQGRGHGEEHCQPAAGHDQRHEQAEVMDSWDLAMERWGHGRGSGLEPRDSAALGPDHPQTEAGCGGRGCWNEGTGLGGCQRKSPASGRHRSSLPATGPSTEQAFCNSLQEGQRKTHTVRAGHVLAEGTGEKAATG